jgi:hypothetical protein
VASKFFSSASHGHVDGPSSSVSVVSSWEGDREPAGIEWTTSGTQPGVLAPSALRSAPEKVRRRWTFRSRGEADLRGRETCIDRHSELLPTDRQPTHNLLDTYKSVKEGSRPFDGNMGTREHPCMGTGELLALGRACRLA